VSRRIVAAEIRKIGGQLVRIGHHDFYAVAGAMPEPLGSQSQAEERSPAPVDGTRAFAAINPQGPFTTLPVSLAQFQTRPHRPASRT